MCEVKTEVKRSDVTICVCVFFKAEPSANLEANDGGILENDRFSVGRFIKKTCVVSVRLRVWFAVNQGHVLWLYPAWPITPWPPSRALRCHDRKRERKAA